MYFNLSFYIYLITILEREFVHRWLYIHKFAFLCISMINTCVYIYECYGISETWINLGLGDINIFLQTEDDKLNINDSIKVSNMNLNQCRSPYLAFALKSIKLISEISFLDFYHANKFFWFILLSYIAIQIFKIIVFSVWCN